VSSTPDRQAAAVELGDVTLGHLDLDELLAELLERAVELLHVDTAAVLLLDASGVDLVARAARGIEEEVRQGVRVPVGTGFAGRIAAEGRTVVLDRVDESTVRNPILWRRGIKTMLGTPLRADGRLVGVMHVGSKHERLFVDRDTEILELIADRIGIALHVRLLEADRDAAEAIQRSLLPSAPSIVADFTCSARYVPAERGGLGGDWYDVFQIDDGSVWFVVGDVTGHGLRAATVMGRVRSALRAYALLGEGPDEVLAMTDRKMAHFEVGTMATAAIAVFCPPYDEALVALAGHPPPVHASRGHDPVLVAARPGPPLGVGTAGRPASTTVPMARGDVLVGYTDGLIERRGESIELGLERVRSSVSAKDPSGLCDDVMSSVVGNHIPEDDIALLAVRRRDQPRG
jgi:serine phosphatase RsbU (regulator of sigma subunit)